MKKRLISTLVITCMIALTGAFAANSAQHEPVFQEWGGAGPGSFTFAAMAAIGEAVNATSDFLSVNVQTTVGSLAHYHMFEQGFLHAGSGAGTTDIEAWTGGTTNFPQPIQSFRSILVFTRTFQTIIVRADSGIYTVADLEGRTIAVGAAGAPAAAIAAGTLSALGVNANFVYTTSAEMVDLYIDGRVDVFMLTSAGGNANVINVMNSVNSRLINLTDEEIQTVLEGELRGRITATQLTNDIYDFIPEDAPLNVLMEITVLNVVDTTEDHVVREILDIYWSQHADLFAVLRGLNGLPEDILRVSAYIHPEAARFYEEVFNIYIPADRVLP